MKTTSDKIVLSVIVPMYNVSSYVDECIDNLTSQSLTDFEVIFIDDSSIDDSFEKVRKAITNVRRKDIFFKLFSQEYNMGVACARNVGLEKASGEYIYFYDADDRLEPDTLLTLYSEAQRQKSDIVGCEWFISFAQNERHIKQRDVQRGVDLFRGFASGIIRWNLWLFMVRRSLYEQNGIRFLPGMNMGEDMMVMMKLALISNRVSIVHKPLYHYSQTNTGAQTKNWSKEKRDQVTANVKEVEAFCRRNYGDSFDLELDFLKQSIKLPFIISDRRDDYKIWANWFPESDKSILRNKSLPFRTRGLQLAAANRQYWILWLYYNVVNKFIYGVIYK